ncbi:MAG TPA: abortive infection family protein [Longimicrobium sp.]
MIDSDLPPDLLGQVEALQNVTLSYATGGAADDVAYQQLRALILDDGSIAGKLPRFVRTCRDIKQFWAYIKKYDTYQERREHIWAEFRPVLDQLEGRARAPLDEATAHALAAFNVETVHSVWGRAVARRGEDPEGAITSARTLLESICKHILDAAAVPYDDAADLPKLYGLAATQLNIAPSQHTEEVFKQILGGCFSVVNGLGALRNRLSDSHGKGKYSAKPSARHAELAVNLAGAVATFLVSTWQARESQED